MSAETVALDADGMIAEGRELAKIADNIAIKVPLTWPGSRPARMLSDEGRMVNVDALLLGQPGASCGEGRGDVHLALHRAARHVNIDGMQLIADIRQIYDNLRLHDEHPRGLDPTVNHMTEAAKIGADVATAPPEVIRKMAQHPLTDKGLETFLADWAKTGQKIL